MMMVVAVMVAAADGFLAGEYTSYSPQADLCIISRQVAEGGRWRETERGGKMVG